MSTTTEQALGPYGVRPPGYRLPDVTHIGCVRLQIADLDRSIAYYESVIGLRVVNRSNTVAKRSSARTLLSAKACTRSRALVDA